MATCDELDALEYPRHVHAVPWTAGSRIVKNATECAAALAEGWTLTCEDAAEVAEAIGVLESVIPADEPLVVEPKKRGRPKKGA